MLECGTQCSVESVFFFIRGVEGRSICTKQSGKSPRVKGMLMDIKRSLMPTGDSVNDGSREERTAKPTPWMRGEPGGRPFQKKVYPPVTSVIDPHHKDGFHWVQLWRCCSAGGQQQTKYVAVLGYYLRCREVCVHSMQQRKVIFDRRVRLSD